MPATSRATRRIQCRSICGASIVATTSVSTLSGMRTKRSVLRRVRKSQAISTLARRPPRCRRVREEYCPAGIGLSRPRTSQVEGPRGLSELRQMESRARNHQVDLHARTRRPRCLHHKRCCSSAKDRDRTRRQRRTGKRRDRARRHHVRRCPGTLPVPPRGHQRLLSRSLP